MLNENSSEYFKLPEEFEKFIRTQEVSITPYDEVYIGGVQA